MKRTGFVIVVLATLILALSYIASLGTFSPIRNAHATSRTITLAGSFATGWNGTNPGPRITVTVGDTVALHLVSSDGYPHTFVIDVAHAGVVSNPNCSVDKCSSQFTSSTTFLFTADMGPGTYTYYCSIHLQHMTGTIIVQSGSNNAPDFTVTSNPTVLSVNQGSSVSATLALNSLNGFSGTVELAALVSPSGPMVSLSPSTVTLSPNGSGSSTLSVSTSSTGLYSTPVSAGAYTVTVSEKSGSISHTTTVTVNIGSTSSSGSTSSMPTYGNSMSSSLLLGVAIVIVAAAAGTIAVLVGRYRRK